MFRKNDDTARKPVMVSVFRILHCGLFCYAAAIVAISFFPDGGPVQGDPFHRVFALAVGGPMMVCSLFFWLAVTARIFFGLGIFFCAALGFALAALPIMMNIFFPMHLVGFTLSAFYAVSTLILARYLFSLPVKKSR